MNILYVAHGLIISHDAANKCLLVEWHGKHSGPEKQACCLEVLRRIQTTQSTKMLVDGSHDLDTWTDAVHWLGHEYQRALVDNGVEAVAWVLPRQLRARADAQQVLQLVRQSAKGARHFLATDTFHDIEAAHTWLTFRTTRARKLSTTDRPENV